MVLGVPHSFDAGATVDPVLAALNWLKIPLRVPPFAAEHDPS